MIKMNHIDDKENKNNIIFVTFLIKILLW